MGKKRRNSGLGIVRKRNRHRFAQNCEPQLDASPSTVRVDTSPSTVRVDENAPKPSPLTDSSSSIGSKSDFSWETQKQQRVTVSQLFTEHLDSPPEEDDKSTVSKILKILPNYSYHTVLNVIKETRREAKRNKLYVGDRKSRIFKGDLLIPEGSAYERVIADFVESGMG